MASYSVLLKRAVCLCPGGYWVWWRMVMVMTAMVMMFVGKCSGNKTEIMMIAQECVVYHMAKGDSSPVVNFKENLTVGYNDSNPEGLSFMIKTDDYLKWISLDDLDETLCSNESSGNRKILLPQLGPANPFRWMNVSLRNGSIIVNNEMVLCDIVESAGGKSALKITANDHPVNVVFNCQNGCPIYTDSTVSKHEGQLEKEKIFVKRARDNASADVALVQRNSLTDDVKKTVSFRLSFLKETDSWEQLEFSVRQSQENLSFAELKLGEEIIWMGKIEKNSYMSFDLMSSEGMDWAIGCDPRPDSQDSFFTPEVIELLWKYGPHVISFLAHTLTLIIIYVLMKKRFIKMRNSLISPLRDRSDVQRRQKGISGATYLTYDLAHASFSRDIGNSAENHHYEYIDHDVLREQLQRDKEEMEENYRREAASGNRDDLSRHVTVNSLYGEMRETE